MATRKTRSKRKPLKGWRALEDDLNRLEDLFFEKEGFKGKFNMEDWGSHKAKGQEHEPQEENFCGTSACMAGWLAVVSRNGFDAKWDADGSLVANSETGRSRRNFDFDWLAMEIYGMRHTEANFLFMTNLDATGKRALRDKIAEARKIVEEIKAREQGDD